MIVSKPIESSAGRRHPASREKNSMLHCRTLLVPISWSQSVLVVFPRKGRGHAIRHRIKTRHFDRTHRRPDAAGGGCRVWIRGGFRFACLGEGAISAAVIDGYEYKAHAPGNVRHEPRDSRSHRDRQLVRNPQPDFRWTHGTRDWPRRQFPACDGQEAGKLVAVGGGGRGVPRPYFREGSAARRSTHATHL